MSGFNPMNSIVECELWRYRRDVIQAGLYGAFDLPLEDKRTAGKPDDNSIGRE
jgi:hypothetical protein